MYSDLDAKLPSKQSVILIYYQGCYLCKSIVVIKITNSVMARIQGNWEKFLFKLVEIRGGISGQIFYFRGGNAPPRPPPCLRACCASPFDCLRLLIVYPLSVVILRAQIIAILNTPCRSIIITTFSIHYSSGMTDGDRDVKLLTKSKITI